MASRAHLLLFFLLLDLFRDNVTHAAVQPLWLGALLNPTNADGTVAPQGSQQLAAFMMAVREINTKNDNVADDLLPNFELKIQLKSAYGYLGAVTKSSEFNNYGSLAGGRKVLAVVGALDDEETMSAARMLEANQTVHVVAESRASELSKGRDFPYKVRVAASESFCGMAMRTIIYGHFGYRRIAIFSTADYFSSQSLHALLADTVNMPFEVLIKQMVEPGWLDFSKEIDAVKATGAVVFVLLVDSDTAAALLVQGRRRGLFAQGTIVFLHDYAIDQHMIDIIHANSPNDDVDAILKGVYGFINDPAYSARKNAEFMQRWRANPSTKPSGGGCATATDDLTPGTPLYYASAHALDAQSNPAQYCAGFDFSTFPADGSTLNDFAPNVYDAVYAVARALHYLLEVKKVPYSGPTSGLTGGAIMDALINQTNFLGITNTVSFSDGDHVNGGVSVDRFGRGDREAGYTYNVLNYHSVDNGWVDVGRWDVEDDWQVCHFMLILACR